MTLWSWCLRNASAHVLVGDGVSRLDSTLIVGTSSDARNTENQQTSKQTYHGVPFGDNKVGEKGLEYYSRPLKRVLYD